MSKKLAVFFPGRKYGVDCPLLYYADFLCKLHGYECMYMHYAAHREEVSDSTLEEDIANANAYVKERMDSINFAKYEEVLFVSKSIGTAAASFTQQKYDLNVRNVYFTPITHTLPYLRDIGKKRECLVIAGTNDSFLQAEILQETCKNAGLKLVQFDGLGHSMETDSVSESLDIIKDVMEIVEEFLVTIQPCKNDCAN